MVNGKPAKSYINILIWCKCLFHYPPPPPPPHFPSFYFLRSVSISLWQTFAESYSPPPKKNLVGIGHNVQPHFTRRERLIYINWIYTFFRGIAEGGEGLQRERPNLFSLASVNKIIRVFGLKRGRTSHIGLYLGPNFANCTTLLKFFGVRLRCNFI